MILSLSQHCVSEPQVIRLTTFQIILDFNKFLISIILDIDKFLISIVRLSGSRAIRFLQNQILLDDPIFAQTGEKCLNSMKKSNMFFFIKSFLL